MQYDDISHDLLDADRELSERLYVPKFLDQMDDLEGAFSLIKAMDFVITPGTSVAIMAGALGVPALSFGPPSPMTYRSSYELSEHPWYENHWYLPIKTVMESTHILDQGSSVIDRFITKRSGRA